MSSQSASCKTAWRGTLVTKGSMGEDLATLTQSSLATMNAFCRLKEMLALYHKEMLGRDEKRISQDGLQLGKNLCPRGKEATD